MKYNWRNLPVNSFSEIKDDVREAILAAYSQGASDVEVRRMLADACSGCFSRRTWYKWLAIDDDFKDFIEFGRDLCESWWLDAGRKHLKDKSFSYVGWYMQMKNRFGWRDSHDVSNRLIFNEMPTVIAGDQELDFAVGEKITKDDANG